MMRQIKLFWLTTLLTFLLAMLSATSVSAEPAEFDCVVEPHEIVELSSAVPGILEEILVDRSDIVKKDQIVAQLHSGVEKANLNVAKAKANFNGDIDARKARLDFASRKLKRTQQLFEKKAISFDLKDEAATEAQIAKMALHQAREKKQLANLELKRSEQMLNLRTIRSPIDGIVIDRTISPGAYVKTQPILKIAKVDPLRVETYIPSSLYNKIKPGMQAEILPEAPLQGAFPAVVTIVDKVIDAASGTYSVRLELPNKENRIPAGLKCKVRFINNKQHPETAAR